VKRFLFVAFCLVGLLAFAPAIASAAMPNPTGLDLPEEFSEIGAPVHSFTTQSGHVVHYIDQGKDSWRTVVLIGGAGTGVQAFELTEFTRELREDLHIRVVCVERNGFGMTEFEPADASGAMIHADAGNAALALADPVKTREMYAQNVLQVLDHLDIGRFSIIGISGTLIKDAASIIVNLAFMVFTRERSAIVLPAFLLYMLFTQRGSGWRSWAASRARSCWPSPTTSGATASRPRSTR